jgi:acetylornithine deacetylase
VPGETAATLRQELEAIVAECAARDPQFRAEIAIGLEREPFETAPGAAILDALRASAAELLGAAPPVEGASYWADAALIQARGIPTVMYGPAGAGAHAAVEYVETRSLERVAAVLERTIARFCA